MRSRSTWILAALLGVSLALHARSFWVRAPRPLPAPSATSPHASPPAKVVPPPSQDPLACERKLEACEERSWEIVRKAIAADRAPRALPKETSGRARGHDGAAQREALCKGAEETMRERWHRDRAEIASGLADSLADKEKQERHARDDVAKVREVTGINESSAAELERAYVESRLARVAQGRAAVAREPPDYDGLFAALKGLYADEDAILERVGGQAAKDAWRSRQVQERTVLLAIAAAMADKDWEESIRW